MQGKDNESGDDLLPILSSIEKVQVLEHAGLFSIFRVGCETLNSPAKEYESTQFNMQEMKFVKCMDIFNCQSARSDAHWVTLSSVYQTELEFLSQFHRPREWKTFGKRKGNK